MEFQNKGYNSYVVDLAVSSITVSEATVVGNGMTLQKCINILKRGNADFKAKVGSTDVLLPNAFGMVGDDLIVSGIVDESGVQTVYSGEFAMGTGANKDKLYLTMHSDTV